MCINGAAAHLVSRGDVVIVVSYCRIDQSLVDSFAPTIVLVDKNNNVLDPAWQDLDI